MRSVLAGEADRQRECADEDEAQRPGLIQIEPAPRQELETQIAVCEPCRPAARRNHCQRMDQGDQDGHAEVRVDQSACRLVAGVQVSGAAQTQRVGQSMRLTSAGSVPFQPGPTRANRPPS